jgi:hypothetical protein
MDAHYTALPSFRELAQPDMPSMTKKNETMTGIIDENHLP